MKPVIQMRVEVEEKAQLLAEAKAEGISLSDLLRRRCLRDHGHPSPKPQILRAPKAKEAGYVAPEPQPISPDFQQRVNFFKNARGMTTKRAEDAARQEAA